LVWTGNCNEQFYYDDFGIILLLMSIYLEFTGWQDARIKSRFRLIYKNSRYHAAVSFSHLIRFFLCSNATNNFAIRVRFALRGAGDLLYEPLDGDSSSLKRFAPRLF
jgi:hypothetical protein